MSDVDADEGVPFPKSVKTESWVVRLARRRLPVLGWAQSYSRGDALADLVAGLTLGLTLVPQSIAYAALANLPVQYGLYSSFVGTMLYVVLGTVKEVSIGPTSLMALMTLQICHGLPIQFVVLLTFLSGCLVLAMGLLKLGFLVDLISPAVTSGFTSGTAVIIMVAQVKGLLGLSFTAESPLENVALISQSIHSARLGDCLLSAVCCTTLLLLRKVKDVRVPPKRRRLGQALWLLSISRNALVVCAAATLAYCSQDPRSATHPWFKLSGRVEPGLPALALPPFSAALHNGTEAVGFAGMVARLGPGLFMLPVVMVLANIAIAKAFSTGGRVDATQEMVTLGLCNVAGSLVGAMPTCGAFTRSAVSHSSGVRSPLAGLYSGIITLLALIFMTQYFYFIPKACLSSVLICAVMFMVDVGTVARLWGERERERERERGGRAELCVVLGTLAVSVLVSVELALLCGALAELVRPLRALLRPRLDLTAHKTSAGTVARLAVAPGLVYLSAELFSERAQLAAGLVRPRPLLLDCGQMSLLDHTATQVLERLIKKLQSWDQQVILYNAPARTARVLERVRGVQRAALRAAGLRDALRLAALSAAPPPASAAAAAAATAPLLAPAPTDDNV